MFVIAIGLGIFMLFIGKHEQSMTTIDIARLCKVDIDENAWEYIVLHHSATNEGNASSFDKYHRKKKKWSHGLAYHFVIGNGNGSGDGEIEVGNRWKQQLHGAHTANMDLNRIAIGICLVGNYEEDNKPTPSQLESLVSLINYLSKRYGITKSNIIMHNQVVQKRTACPGKNFPYQKIMYRTTPLQPPEMYGGL